MKKMSLFVLFVLVAMGWSCDSVPTSDDIQRKQQEVLLKEATSEVGMPAIKNFRERKIMKDILELRDQNGLITYTYLENLNPQVILGRTALGGKLVYFGETIGYPIPYSTQYTNPEKTEWRDHHGYFILPQADPNGLFSPSATEATWILMKDPNSKNVQPIYVEPRVVCLPFKLKFD